jgi:outer membrane protein insertion porin family
MGGIGSVRGYNPYSLSPEVLGDRIGGTERASATVEANIPLSEAAKMRLSFFYDYGVIDTDGVRKKTAADGSIEYVNFDNSIISRTGDSVSRSSAGVVLEWQSGFGPINLVFAYPIDDEDYDDTAAFEFSMGTKF